MDILFKKVYKFNLDTNKPEEIVLTNQAKDFNDYIEQLLEAVIDDDRSKRFVFPKDDTSIKTWLGEIVEGEQAGIAKNIAERLLRVEGEVQGRIEHLDIEVQKGILIQALVEVNDKKRYVIVKAEHADFINESDNRKATGLPIKKKIYKSFWALIDSKNKVKYAHVGDNKANISTYWWNTFLELQAEHTDDYNTVKAFESIDVKVFDKIKADYPADYMYLRNATVQYFRSKTEFELQDFLDSIIKNYTPENEQLDVENLRTKIQELPEKQEFDNRFTIKKEKIKKRIINRLKLTPQLDLIINENIAWGKMVQPFKEQGAKYIMIRTDAGYDHFLKK